MINTFTGLENCTRCSYVGCVGGTLGHLKFIGKMKLRKAKARFHAFKRSFTALDYSKISNIDVANIHHWDAHEYSDAYIHSATYKGRDMTDAELERLNEDSGFVHEQVLAKIY